MKITRPLQGNRFHTSRRMRLALLVGVSVALLPAANASASSGQITSAYANVAGTRAHIVASVTWTGCEVSDGRYTECEWNAGVVSEELMKDGKCPEVPEELAWTLRTATVEREGEYSGEGPDANGTVLFDGTMKLPYRWKEPCIYLVVKQEGSRPHSNNSECERDHLPVSLCPPTEETFYYGPTLARTRLKVWPNKGRCHVVFPAYSIRPYIKCEKRRNRGEVSIVRQSSQQPY